MRSDNPTRRGRKGQGNSDRAQRFAIHVPVRYRLPPSPDWFVARTENVSRSGILFPTECIFEPATPLDVRFELPLSDKDGVHAEVVCKGEVVRVEQTYPGGISPTMAVAIHNYRLEQRRQPN